MTCSADISSEKKPTMPPFVPAAVLPDAMRRVGAARNAMLVASAVFPHRRTAGEDDEVGTMQPAQRRIEIGEAGRHTGERAFPPMRRVRRRQRLAQHVGRAQEARAARPAAPVSARS